MIMVRVHLVLIIAARIIRILLATHIRKNAKISRIICFVYSCHYYLITIFTLGIYYHHYHYYSKPWL